MTDRSDNGTANGIPKGMIIAIIAAAIAVVLLTAAVIYLCMHRYTGDDASLPDNEEVLDALEIVGSSDDEAKDSPAGWYGTLESSGDVTVDVDFDSYMAVCPDIYAYIEIPQTDVSYPIVYCEDAVDPFYFTHSIDGSESDKGSIITDSMNSMDFSDPVTLIYGQSPDDGTMFGGLHRFKDASYFDSHDTINIVLPDAMLVYRIYACYTGSAEHILVGNDFNDPVSFMRFFDSVSGIRDLSMNIRQDAKPQLGDHVIILVTHCADESRRLFVCAVLEEVRY